MPAIGDRDDQHVPRPPPELAPLSLGDPCLDGDHLTDGQVPEIGQLPTLLVAPGKMGEQVTDRLQFQGIGEHRGGSRTHHVPKSRLLVDHVHDPARRHRQLRPAPERAHERPVWASHGLALSGTATLWGSLG